MTHDALPIRRDDLALHEGPTTASRRALLMKNGLALFAAALLTAGLVSWYVLQERFFYYWDWSGFHLVTVDQMVLYKQSLAKGFASLRESMGQDYPFTYCQPLIPMLMLLGSSRLAYVLSVALLYQLPYLLLMAAISRRMIGGQGSAAFWASCAVVALLPHAWIPLLRGYPDAGAAALMALALWLYVGDMELRGKWRILAIGLCLGFIPLVRRHFAYDCIAFAAAVVLHACATAAMQFPKKGRLAFYACLSKMLRLATVGAIALGILLILGSTYVRHVIATPYASLYVSYTHSPSAVAAWCCQQYGWVTLTLAVLGFLAALIKFRDARPTIAFVALFGGLCMLMWGLFARQFGSHFTYHFSWFVFSGVVLAFWTAWRSIGPRLRPVFVVVALAAMLLNLAVGLGSWNWLNDRPAMAACFAKSWPPLQRGDCKEVCRLVDRLRQLTTPDEWIFVVGSSAVVNDDVLRSAERQTYGSDGRRLRLYIPPHIDSRDFYPLEGILASQYVVVAQPHQFHIGGEKQKVVRAAGDAFVEPWEIADDFDALPETYALDQGVTVRVYQRRQASSLTSALRSLDRMQAILPTRPGQQSAWLFVHQPRLLHVPTDPQFLLQFDPTNAAATPFAELVCIDPAPPRGEMHGVLEFLDQGSSSIRIEVAAVRSNGESQRCGEAVFSPDQPREFSFPFEAPSGTRIVLTVTPSTARGLSQSSSDENATVPFTSTQFSSDENGTVPFRKTGGGTVCLKSLRVVTR